MVLIKVKPNQAFKMLGTGIVLDPQQAYLAVNATNIPNWRATRSVYVLVNSDGSPVAHSVETAATFLETAATFLLSGADYTPA